MEKEIYIPVKDYANKHKCTVQNVYYLLRKGKIQGKKIGTYQLIKD